MIKKKENWYKISVQEQKPETYQMELNIPIPKTCFEIISHLKSQGYLSLIVGGAVRDSFLGIKSKDIDVEVYGLDYNTLTNILEPFGKIDLVGKKFGIIKITDKEKNTYDFSIPRRDNKIGKGHKGFNVEFDQSITPKEAASRRDFTVNSLAYNPISKTVYDFFGGIEDLNNKVLRATSPAFAEDSLRVLRGMQFSSRFGFDIEPETAKMCASLKHEPLVIERVSEEWMKLFTKGKYPEKTLQYLIDTEWIDNYPELKMIVGVPQDKEWHPEGTVDAHLSISIQQAARIADRDNLKGDERAVILLSALCHDLGKSTTTQTEIKDGKERITSKGHDIESADLARSFMDRIGIKKEISAQVIPLVKMHMFHLDYDSTSKKANVLQLADRIYPATIEQLEKMIEIDHSSRPPLPGGVPDEAQQMVNHAREKNVYKGKSEPLIQGRDIMYLFPFPGPAVGETLKYVRNLQLQGIIRTPEEAIKRADEYAMKKSLFINGDDILSIIREYYNPEIKGGPFVGEVLKKIWELQKTNKIKDREEALSYVEVELINKGIIEAKKMENILKYSEHNMNFKKAEDEQDSVEIIYKEFQRGKNRQEINWDRIKMSLNDDTMFGDVRGYWESNPEHAFQTYQEIFDENLQEEVSAFLASNILKTSQVLKMPASSSTDISELESAFGQSAQEAIQMVPPDFLQGIQRIGITDDSSVAGVYRPALTVYLYQEFLKENGIKIEELSDEDKEKYFSYMKQLQDTQGLAFELSPQKIDSEINKLYDELNPYYEYLSTKMSEEELQSWKKETEKIIQSLVIAEIIVHESVHAHGAKDEGQPVAIEKSFLNQKIQEINSQREGEGKFPIPLTTK